MTKNEAIEVLRHLQDSDYPMYSEALEMAIKSLEAWKKIRTEIKKESEVKILQLHWGEAMGLNKAVEIIDKHLLGVSE